jgi:replicative DNA helicase
MSDPTLRVPPQSLDSERALLGAILLKPDVIHDVGDTVKGDSFYAEKHKVIFEAMHELSGKGEPKKRRRRQALLRLPPAKAYDCT